MHLWIGGHVPGPVVQRYKIIRVMIEDTFIKEGVRYTKQ